MKKKAVIGLMVGTLTLGIGTGALAATGLEPIKAYLNSKISLKMNGATVTAKDANGKTVLPITYNGTTYLPVRAVGTLLGTEITYDSATSSVLIGSGSGSAAPEENKLTLSSLGATALGTSGWHTGSGRHLVQRERLQRCISSYGLRETRRKLPDHDTKKVFQVTFGTGSHYGFPRDQNYRS